MATKFEQLCAAYGTSRDGFAAYRAECTAFLLRVGRQLETAWGVPGLRFGHPVNDKAKKPDKPETPEKPEPGKAEEALFDPSTGFFRLEVSFDVHAGKDEKTKRAVTVPLAARQEGNGFLLSVDDTEPRNVGAGTEADVAPVIDEAFARVLARFEQDARRVRDAQP